VSMPSSAYKPKQSTSLWNFHSTTLCVYFICYFIRILPYIFFFTNRARMRLRA
jgi:hypothetical protein